jgi:hypothetical protein
MWRRVGLARADVSEERVSSVFGVDKSASRLNHDPKNTNYIRTAKENGLRGKLMRRKRLHGFFYPEDGGDMFLRNVLLSLYVSAMPGHLQVQKYAVPR